MYDLTLQAVLMRCVALMPLAVIQGLGVATVAVALGDPGPRHDGRLSLSPGHHIDAIGAAGLILFGLGWSRFTAVDPGRLRGGRAGLVAVALGGFAALLVAAAMFRLLIPTALSVLPLSGGLMAAAFLRMAAALALDAALLGLLPVPPLPGGHLLTLVRLDLPERWHALAGATLLGLMTLGMMHGLIAPLAAALDPLLQFVAPR